MPKGAFTALHSTAWACCLSLQHNEESNGYTESVVGQSIFISNSKEVQNKFETSSEEHEAKDSDGKTDITLLLAIARKL